MNGYTRRKLYQIVAKRDGEFCKGCQSLPTEKQLILDHIDNNNKNSEVNNLQLLCRACNYRKDPRRPVDVCECESEAPDQTELEVNRTREPQFRKFASHKINENRTVPEKDLIYSGAEHVGISPVTAKRYLDKMCSSTGILKRKQVGKTIVIDYKDELPLI